MVSLFLDEMRTVENGESEGELRDQIEDIVLRLTGKETIHQMSALAEEVGKRGGKPKAAAEYKSIFAERLNALVKLRLAKLRAGEVDRESLLVPGARAVLDLLVERDVALFLASGTDEENVKQEAEALGLTSYFAERIFGAREDRRGFTKAAVVKHLLSGAGYKPGELAGFGDGFVEIREVSQAGGFAIGLATAEPECRVVDQGKRRHLIAAGAHIILPNYGGLSEWSELLFHRDAPVLTVPSR
jgi:phosphoglycolate phosphatase-like HAD superfamily hydrolase